jgi:hypothetical protein
LLASIELVVSFAAERGLFDIETEVPAEYGLFVFDYDLLRISLSLFF